MAAESSAPCSIPTRELPDPVRHAHAPQQAPRVGCNPEAPPPPRQTPPTHYRALSLGSPDLAADPPRCPRISNPAATATSGPLPLFFLEFTSYVEMVPITRKLLSHSWLSKPVRKLIPFVGRFDAWVLKIIKEEPSGSLIGNPYRFSTPPSLQNLRACPTHTCSFAE